MSMEDDEREESGGGDERDKGVNLGSLGGQLWKRCVAVVERWNGELNWTKDRHKTIITVAVGCLDVAPSFVAHGGGVKYLICPCLEIITVLSYGQRGASELMNAYRKTEFIKANFMNDYQLLIQLFSFFFYKKIPPTQLLGSKSGIIY